MAEPPVVVVGAGLAGLSCAIHLHRHGIPVTVLEASDDVGGRVRTDTVAGFTVDRGFQVLNTAYPALRRVADLDGLDLRLLPRGVRVRRGGRVHAVPHPLASPSAPFRALASGAAGPRAKLALARYAATLTTAPADALKQRPDVPATSAWAERLPDEAVADLLVPFFSGVVLEHELTTSRVFTDLMMRMFARGSSAVPAAGMQALPRQLAQQLPRDAVRLESRVTSVVPGAVALADSTIRHARAVVVATDPWAAADLVPDVGPAPQPRGVTTYYFAADPWPGLDGTLVVDADGSTVTNSVVLTASAPEYSSDGRALVATSVVHDARAAEQPGEEAGDAVRSIAAELHGAREGSWEQIAVRSIPRALPAMPAPHPLRKPVFLPRAGVWVAGDHRDTSSIQGALVSGTRVATSVLRGLAAA